MKVIACPWGMVLKFDDLKDLEQHSANLAGLVEWTQEKQARGEQTKLVYSIREDRLPTSEEIEAFLNELPDLPGLG